MTHDLSGKTALVTGAFGLLGQQHCLALASAGAFVVGCDIGGDAMELSWHRCLPRRGFMKPLRGKGVFAT